MPQPPALDPAPGGKLQEDAAIAALATRQHGVVARRQLLAIGVGSRAIEHRIEASRLHVVHRGVYAVGHRALAERGRWMAAILAAGPGAALSHHHAAALHGMRRTSRAAVHVTVPRAVRSRLGIRTHHSPLPPDELTIVHGIPVTGVSRTLFDLAAILEYHQLERAANEAEYLELTDPVSLGDLVVRYPTRKGSAQVRRLLRANRIGRTRTRSELEVAFVAFLDAHDLPRPDFNVPITIAGREIVADCVWWDARVIVELDVVHTHGGIGSFHDDRERDRALQALGWRTARVTDRHLEAARADLARDLRSLLSALPETLRVVG